VVRYPTIGAERPAGDYVAVPPCRIASRHPGPHRARPGPCWPGRSSRLPP